MQAVQASTGARRIQRRMRILLLVNQFPPDINPTGKLMYALALGLQQRGHQVHVMTAFPHYAEFRIWPEYRGRWIATGHEEGVQVTRVRVFASGQKQRMSHRLASYLTYNMAALLAAQASPLDYDVILAPNGSFFTGLTAAVLGAARRIPFVYNVQDVYPDVPARAGQLPHPLQVHWLQRLERLMYRTAAHVTVISESQRENLLGKGVPPAKLSIIPNFVDVQHNQPRDPDEALRERLGWSDRFVVAYSGNLGFAYDFDALLAAAHLLADNEQILVAIIGEGVRKAELAARVTQLGLDNVQFQPFLPEAELPALRASAAMQLSLYRPGASQLSLPSKLYEIMASARPVVASAEAESDVARLVRRADAGIVIEPDRPDLLAAAIRTLHADAGLRERLGRQGRAFVCAHHSVDRIVDEYESLLHDCITSTLTR